MKKKPEILAPAGNMECLVAAINAGADAVYVGGDRFGARAYAGNFQEEELLHAIDEVHKKDKKLYLTVNTLVKWDEDVIEYLLPFYKQGLDAVIVQDVGVFSRIHKAFPDLPLHASTQMGICSKEGARLALEMGACRVVPARELTIEEVKEITAIPNLEVECFVHGALCYCYSGHCLLSSRRGGRSGNRGRCAQPCRLPYMVDCGDYVEKDTYILSPKDICTIEMIPDLVKAGIDSFKIEGRMKSPEYVKTVTYFYQKYLDEYHKVGAFNYQVTKDDKDQILTVFNRGGSGTGYYNTLPGKQMMSIKKPNHQGILIGNVEQIGKGTISFHLLAHIYVRDSMLITLDNGQVVELTSPVELEKGSYITLNANQLKRIRKGQAVYCMKSLASLERIPEVMMKEQVEGVLTLCPNKPLTLTVQLNEEEITVFGETVLEAKTQPLTKEKIYKAVNQTGDSQYSFSKLEINLLGNCFVPVKTLKAIRRDALEQLTYNRLNHYKREEKCKETGFEEEPSLRDVSGELMVSLDKEDGFLLTVNCKEVKKIVLPLLYTSKELAKNRYELAKSKGKKLFYALPSMARTETIEWLKNQVSWMLDYADGVMVKTIDELGFSKTHFQNKEIHLDSSMYAYNSDALLEYSRILNETSALSYTAGLELTMGEVEKVSEKGCYLYCYGCIQTMVSAQSIAKTLERKSKDNVKIQDEKGEVYFTKADPLAYAEKIYEATPVSLLQQGFGSFVNSKKYGMRIHFTNETKEEITKVLDAATEMIQDGEVSAKKAIEGKSIYEKGMH